ncbi:hypothetical protein GXW82_44000 [Streptacidiphilus sp. 4-A2]|nr:hypothetical protein [Streptacidiphilus sp. 4-A2]
MRAVVRRAVRRWQRDVEDEVRRRRCDVVVESGAVDLDDFRRDAVAYREAGFRLELLVVAAGEPWSQLGTLEWCLAQGRLVGWRGHDDSADALMAALVVIKDERLVDQVTVVDRDDQPL